MAPRRKRSTKRSRTPKGKVRVRIRDKEFFATKKVDNRTRTQKVRDLRNNKNLPPALRQRAIDVVLGKIILNPRAKKKKTTRKRTKTGRKKRTTKRR